MTKRKHQMQVVELGRLLVYILGHKPAEFALVPSDAGFVPFKELLKAIHEEPGWSHVRRSHINEVLLGKDRHFFEVEGNHIRVRSRKWERSTAILDPSDLPKILFTAVRRRAHAPAMEKGLKSGAGTYLVLSADEEIALRIGKRRDSNPVLLSVEAEKARREGIPVRSFDNLFLCYEIPPRYLHGPPVAKETLAPPLETAYKPPTPGTFLLDLAGDPDPMRRSRGKKRKGWKESARKMRRNKRR